LDLARIGKFQSFPRDGMDAGTLPKLSAKGNRLWRLPLSGRVIHGKRRKYRPGLHIIAKSRARGRGAA
jgi:hypothetical protein